MGNDNDANETSAPLILGICLGVALLLFLSVCFWICKDLCKSWHLVRERNRNNTDDEQDAQAIEMLPQDFEQIARAANILANALTARRQENPTDDATANVDSDGHNSDDQLDETFSGDDNETETGSVRKVRRKRRVTFNLGDEEDSSKDKKDGKSSSPGKSSLKSSSSSDGTVDKVEADSSKYDTASGSSSGGGDARATSPWAEFE